MVTDHEAIEREIAENRAAYEVLKPQIKREHAGRYVALAFGKIVGTAETYGEAVRLVQKLKPAPHAFEVFLAEDEPLFDAIFAPYSEFR